jgi:hypothetical protein
MRKIKRQMRALVCSNPEVALANHPQPVLKEVDLCTTIVATGFLKSGFHVWEILDPDPALQ